MKKLLFKQGDYVQGRNETMERAVFQVTHILGFLGRGVQRLQIRVLNGDTQFEMPSNELEPYWLQDNDVLKGRNYPLELKYIITSTRKEGQGSLRGRFSANGSLNSFTLTSVADLEFHADRLCRK